MRAKEYQQILLQKLIRRYENHYRVSGQKTKDKEDDTYQIYSMNEITRIIKDDLDLVVFERGDGIIIISKQTESDDFYSKKYNKYLIVRNLNKRR
jgi:hypothetical protein